MPALTLQHQGVHRGVGKGLAGRADQTLDQHGPKRIATLWPLHPEQGHTSLVVDGQHAARTAAERSHRLGSRVLS